MQLAVIGTALVVGEWRGVVAVIVIWAAHSRKALGEEALLTRELGEEYASYRRGTGFLLPRLGRGAAIDSMDTRTGRS
jgi:protein-S-isoprenylcysteine O-methyltransferase Ste14